MPDRIYNFLLGKKSKGQKSFAILIDPDRTFNPGKLKQIARLALQSRPDLILVGGSYFLENNMEKCILLLKDLCDIPVVLFPGHISHINYKADALLFLSLISGRNPEYLIGQHVIAAPGLKASGMEIIPTGYVLVDGGCTTTVSYISFTNPIPQDLPGLVSATAQAGELLGMKIIYLEAGSGAVNPVSPQIINEVSHAVSLPLIVGGGINTAPKARQAFDAGADMIVIGNKIDDRPEFIEEIAYVTREVSRVTD